MFRGLGDQIYGLGVAVSVTNACPLTCKHCISNASPSGETADSKFQKQLKLFLEHNDFETSQVTLTGGEPFHDLAQLRKLILLMTFFQNFDAL